VSSGSWYFETFLQEPKYKSELLYSRYHERFHPGPIAHVIRIIQASLMSCPVPCHFLRPCIERLHDSQDSQSELKFLRLTLALLLHLFPTPSGARTLFGTHLKLDKETEQHAFVLRSNETISQSLQKKEKDLTLLAVIVNRLPSCRLRSFKLT
jgi:hypothetical protein